MDENGAVSKSKVRKHTSRVVMRTHYLLQNSKRHYQLFFLLLPAFLYVLIFNYGSTAGIFIAFKNYQPYRGLFESPWVGFKYFKTFFRSYLFPITLGNTLGLSLYGLIAGFPLPIFFAIMLNYLKSKTFKKIVQTVSYAPHFISLVVLVGMLYLFLSPSSGLLNHILTAVGLEPVFFLGEASWFKTVSVASGIWQNMGWGSIIYLAALSNIDSQLYEAAEVDGATKLQTIRHIDIPSLIPTAIILLILRLGRILDLNYQKVLLMQNPLNQRSSEIIGTYVYKAGILQGQFSYATAISVFNAIVSIVLVVTVNRVARKFSETSLW